MNTIKNTIEYWTETIYTILYDSLIYAIQTNNLYFVRLMLENRIERKSWLDTMIYMLYKNIDIHKQFEYAFYIACEFERSEIMKYLLEFGEKTNRRINIHSMYDYSIKKICRSGNVEMMKYLIEYCHKIQDNFTNNFYNKVIIFESCCDNNLELVKYIIEYCEKTNSKIQLNLCIKRIHSNDRSFDNPNMSNILDYLFYLMKHNYNIKDHHTYIKCKNINKYIHRYITTKNVKNTEVKYVLNNVM